MTITMMFKRYVLKEYWNWRLVCFSELCPSYNAFQIVIKIQLLSHLLFSFLFSFFFLDISFCYRQIKLPHWSCFLRISQTLFSILFPRIFSFLAKKISYSFAGNISLFCREYFLFLSWEFFHFLPWEISILFPRIFPFFGASHLFQDWILSAWMGSVIKTWHQFTIGKP